MNKPDRRYNCSGKHMDISQVFTIEYGRYGVKINLNQDYECLIYPEITHDTQDMRPLYQVIDFNFIVYIIFKELWQFSINIQCVLKDKNL